MFLHIILSESAVHVLSKFAGLNASNLIVRAVLCVLLPWGLYYLLKKFPVTKKLVLGEWHLNSPDIISILILPHKTGIL